MSAALAEGMLAVVKAATTPLFDEIKALRAEVEALKSREPVPGPVGPVGQKGDTGSNGNDGKDGEDGKHFTVEMLSAAIAGNKHDIRIALETMLEDALHDSTVEYLKAHPPAAGADGKVGSSGAQGVPGADGKAGCDAPAPTIEQIKAALLDPDVLPIVVAKHFEANPVLNGVDGAQGRDGVGLAGVVIDRDNALVVTLTDGTTKALGVVVGAKGEHGRDGQDGLSFGDLVTEQDERSITFKAVRGEQAKSLGSFTWDPLDYEGVYEAGKSYRRNQTVTWGGSLWVAREDTTAKPGEIGTAKSWTLAVKKGAQGDPGKIGPAGPQGVQGLKGDKGPDRW